MFNLTKILLIIVPVLISVAYLTLAERKVLGYMQARKGPNIVGIYGLLQPLADGVKLFTKEMTIPNHSNIVIYFISPILFLTLALVLWGVLPYSTNASFSEIELGLLFILAVSSVSVYAVLMSGWSSTSKYAYLGALRAAAQMISYEVSMGLIVISVILCVGSLNLSTISWFQINSTFLLLPLLPAAIMFLVSLVAETNRAPFDLTEGESELVSGYNVEYSSMSFALLFLAEYANIIFMSALFSLMFLGGWDGPIISSVIWLGIKTAFVAMFFIWIRASFPRIRYDQLMMLLWKSYLPLSLGFLITTASLLWCLNGLPNL
ncbi:NADH dehydrogenase subunit 1 (mitochondrion) [Rhopilema esculentum]|uniref:NADH-ubiquinone oxidoreductase chain 1 n=1 Tax=Rhopilema esculentum TaxID=499914 RepID=A0A222YWI3_9CNID|nr:NADH dehydrogenase subunit 1 [Rhopilema esculentum]ASR75176.1 NADH dehydrogenase subunit 1 [Rhopilema esculentum]